MVKGGVYQGCNAIFLVQKPSNIMHNINKPKKKKITWSYRLLLIN